MPSIQRLLHPAETIPMQLFFILQVMEHFSSLEEVGRPSILFILLDYTHAWSPVPASACHAILLKPLRMQCALTDSNLMA